MGQRGAKRPTTSSPRADSHPGWILSGGPGPTAATGPWELMLLLPGRAVMPAAVGRSVSTTLSEPCLRVTPGIRPYARCHYHAPGHTMGACQAYYRRKGHTMGVVVRAYYGITL